MTRVKMFKIIAAIILGLMGIFWLYISISGMLAGTPNEIINIILVVITLAIATLAWRRLLLGGLLLCGFGVILALYLFLLPTDLQTVSPLLIFMCAPVTIAGLFFIEADWASRKRN